MIHHDLPHQTCDDPQCSSVRIDGGYLVSSTSVGQVGPLTKVNKIGYFQVALPMGGQVVLYFCCVFLLDTVAYIPMDIPTSDNVFHSQFCLITGQPWLDTKYCSTLIFCNQWQNES